MTKSIYLIGLSNSVAPNGAKLFGSSCFYKDTAPTEHKKNNMSKQAYVNEYRAFIESEE